MPEMVSLFNGVGGLSSFFVAWATIESGQELSAFVLLVTFLALLIGAVTFSGSIIAWAKLSEKITGRAVTFSGQAIFNGLLLLAIVASGALFVTQPENQNCILGGHGVGIAPWHYGGVTYWRG